MREYGFSKAVWQLCPQGWKKPLGNDWEDVLSIILWKWSPETCITKEITHLLCMKKERAVSKINQELVLEKMEVDLCKNSRAGQTDTDTGRTGCTGERHHTRYKNVSEKGFQAKAETSPGRRARKRYPENRNDFRHGTDRRRNRPDRKGALGS